MKRLILVDGNSLMYRAYYGTAMGNNVQQTSTGLYTNAVYAFARMMNKLVSEKYDNILVAFDAGKHTFRHDILGDYKDGRSHMPDEMRMQISYIKEYLDKKGIPQYELDEYEADDIIGTFSDLGNKEGYHVDVYSGDKDLLQLIRPNVTVHLTRKGLSELDDYNEEFFEEKYGIKVNQFIDLKSMQGDASDNLKGIPGVGPKTATKLLLKYETLENIIEHKDEIKGSIGNKVREHIEDVLTTKKMVTILLDTPCTIDFDFSARRPEDVSGLRELYKTLEFNTLLKQLSIENSVEEEASVLEYTLISSPNQVLDVLDKDTTIVFETSTYNYHKADLLGIGFRNKKGLFILLPKLLKESPDLALYLSDPNNKKGIFDYKRCAVLCKRNGLDLLGVDFDLLLAVYLLSPALKTNEFRNIANYFDYTNVSYDEEVYGKGRTFAIPSDDILFNHIAKKTEACYLLRNRALSDLEKMDQTSLLTDIEIPLSYTLAKMEYTGMKIDQDEMKRQHDDVLGQIEVLEKEIHEMSGSDFNISSPKQLGQVLFVDMGLTYTGKKSTLSTAAGVLESIEAEHPIISKVLLYRKLTKLYGTYIEGLSKEIMDDGKVHTIFEQTLTKTGRLSSIEPNLQNIPSRTDMGHNIRKMFIPENPNNSLFSADYSQIELRVLAHMAGVEKMIEGFNSGEDIHSTTAREIFKKDVITKEDRRRAKAVNFGIVYGISSYGLATNTGITNYEANTFIDEYNKVYPEIQEYMDSVIEFAKENGYVKTIKNRIRQIPDIESSNFRLREFAKRTAMNAPIQGSAADIIKIAMIHIDKALTDGNFKSKMICSVHDEVVLEVFSGEEEKVKKLVIENMENAVKLDVVLTADTSFGKNWYEVK